MRRLTEDDFKHASDSILVYSLNFVNQELATLGPKPMSVVPNGLLEALTSVILLAELE